MIRATTARKFVHMITPKQCTCGTLRDAVEDNRKKSAEELTGNQLELVFVGYLFTPKILRTRTAYWGHRAELDQKWFSRTGFGLVWFQFFLVLRTRLWNSNCMCITLLFLNFLALEMHVWAIIHIFSFFIFYLCMSIQTGNACIHACIVF